MRRAISARCGVSVGSTVWNHSSALRIDRSEASAMFLPATRTDSASGLRRAPAQTAQGFSAWYRCSSSRTQTLSVSCRRRCRFFSTPSNGLVTV